MRQNIVNTRTAKDYRNPKTVHLLAECTPPSKCIIVLEALVPIETVRRISAAHAH